MRLERVFGDGPTKTTLLLAIEKDQLEIVLAASGKEKKKTDKVASWSYQEYTKQLQKLLKEGKTTEPLKDSPKIAADLMKAADLDLSDTLDAFVPDERRAIVADALAKAAKAGKIVGNENYPHARAEV